MPQPPTPIASAKPVFNFVPGKSGPKQAKTTRACLSCQKTENEVPFPKEGAQCRRCRYLRDRVLFYDDPPRIERKRKQGRAWKLRAQYGITQDIFCSMLESQHNKCAGCQQKFEMRGKKQACIDHRKSDGVVRGLLCLNCNLSLGLVYDSTKTLRNLISYLEEANAKR